MPHRQSLRNVVNMVSPIDDADWELMKPFVGQKLVKKNDFFLQSGHCCDTIGFVIKGALRTFYIDPKGEDVSVHFQLENNFVVSYESFVTRQVSHYSIEALEDCDLLFFSTEALDNCCLLSHNWERFCRIVAEQMFVVSQRKMQSLLYQSAEERYQQLQNTSPHLMLRIPQYHIASYLGIKPQSLSRIRKNMSIRSLVDHSEM